MCKVKSLRLFSKQTYLAVIHVCLGKGNPNCTAHFHLKREKNVLVILRQNSETYRKFDVD